ARHNGACFSRKSVEFLLLIVHSFGSFGSDNGSWRHSKSTSIPRVRSLMYVRGILDALHQ
ncbi:hypothetical protein, partial [Tetragenococcus halophilus]|uniref:hypothetical protein n=1 Tax=Tetragenococcus halophilus TaxID=51669 RepID=UPI001CA4806D